MHFSITATFSALAFLASAVQASHTITLRNNCGWGAGLRVDNYSGSPYTGAARVDVPAKSSKSVVVPDGWDGRVCDVTASGSSANNCYGACSMAEFNMNSGGLNWYDISNILAYTVPQKISSSCDSVTCTSAGCPCNQAYRPGDKTGTCGGTGPLDQAVRACGGNDFTITYCPAQKDKSTAYSELLQNILNLPQDQIPAALLTYVGLIVNRDQPGIVVARQVLSELAGALEKNKVEDREARKKVIQDVLDTLQPRLVSYEEQTAALRLQMASLLEEEEEWVEAARVLMGISLDSGHRQVSSEEKLQIYIRIVRLLLEEGEHAQADTYCKRAALLIPSTSNRELQLSFKLSQARIADFNRRFYDAALRYNELSWVPELDEDDRANALSAAVTCAVLDPAGPKRSRLLATLFRDERAPSLENYTILKKMFNEHIIRPDEVKGFEATLKPHHLARVAQSQNDKLAARKAAADNDGDTDMTDADTPQSTRTGPTTVLDKAVLEHNLLSASKIYNNITFAGLGALLDLAPAAAETMARRMIGEGRLHASIDQVAKLISFDHTHDARQDDAAGGAGGLGDVVQEVEDTGAPETDKWDLQIRKSASSVESIVQYLREKQLVSVS
ncbi:PCI domain, partial [Rhizoctonia solani]